MQSSPRAQATTNFARGGVFTGRTNGTGQPPEAKKWNKIIKKLYVVSSSLPIKHCPLLRRVVNLKKISEKLKKCISNLKKFYKHLKNLQIFFLNIAMCAEIVFLLRKNLNAHGSAVANMSKKSQWQKPIFQGLISRVLLYIEAMGQVFWIAFGPATICIPFGTVGLLYLF